MINGQGHLEATILQKQYFKNDVNHTNCTKIFTRQIQIILCNTFIIKYKPYTILYP